MKFWDSSAIVPLILDEEETDYCLGVLSQDQEMLIWCLSKVEVFSALSRRRREEKIAQRDFRGAKKRLDFILERAYEVKAIEKVRYRALRLLEVHPLRAADACQLASALVATQEDPNRIGMICFDTRLKNACMKEGFVVNPGKEETGKGCLF